MNFNLEEIRIELETDLTWRTDEIRFLRNQLANIIKEEDKERYRKSLLVMLYSHYEGFCKTAFLIYINVVNNEALQRKRANHHLATCSLHNVFKAFEDGEYKPEIYRGIFKNTLPEEKKLQRFARQVDFIVNLDNFWDEVVSVSDEIADTESNLWPVVLKKILFRLGLPEQSFKKYESNIFALVNMRNGVAHGRDKEGIKEDLYTSIEKGVFDTMQGVIEVIIDALKNKKYLLTVTG